MTSDRGGYVIKIDELPSGENASRRGRGHRRRSSRGPHKFVSRAAAHRQVSIHPVARMETEWLE